MKQPNYQYDSPADLDSRIVTLVHNGLPVCARPYKVIARSLNMGEMALILRVHHLIRESRISRQRPGLWNVNHPNASRKPLTQWDKRLLGLLRKGLPLSSRPYHILARQLEITTDEVLFRTARLQDKGYVHGIGPLL